MSLLDICPNVFDGQLLQGYFIELERKYLRTSIKNKILHYWLLDVKMRCYSHPVLLLLLMKCGVELFTPLSFFYLKRDQLFESNGNNIHIDV